MISLNKEIKFKAAYLSSDLGKNQKRVLEYYQKIKEERIKIENEKFLKRLKKKYLFQFIK